MWPFKKRAAALLEEAQTEVRQHADFPEIAVGMLIEAILAARGRGIHFAHLYATMRDFEGETLGSYNIVQFARIIQQDAPVSALGVQRAITKLCSDIDSILQGEYGDLTLYGVDGSENRQFRTSVEAVRAASKEIGFRRLCEGSNLDLAEFLSQLVSALRSTDIQTVTFRLEGMKLSLRPVLFRAWRTGKDRYGQIDLSQYYKEISDWLEYCFPNNALPFFYMIKPIEIVDSIVSQWLAEGYQTAAIPEGGVDFEIWCASRLEEQGWSVTTTKASGDQGVDLEARRANQTVAIQCKRYSQPIGNSAVQEAHTGRAHYGADACCVIGTGGFTRAAIELASTTGVTLLDAEFIDDFSRLLSTNRGSFH